MTTINNEKMKIFCAENKLYVLKFIIASVPFVVGNNLSEAILVYIKAR